MMMKMTVQFLIIYFIVYTIIYILKAFIYKKLDERKNQKQTKVEKDLDYLQKMSMYYCSLSEEEKDAFFKKMTGEK